MTLYERYKDAETINLLRIVEASKDYTKACVEVVLKILAERNINSSTQKDQILLVNKEIIRNKLNNFNPLKNKIIFHKSQFLNENEIEKHYKNELKKFIQKQDHFGFDVWSYAIGGL
ncbi:MAG: hypothetical protein ACPGVH_04240 [Chitinophagales bacterium]